jgi:beta-mannanase
MFNNGKETQYGTLTGFFIGDGDSFSEDVASLKISGLLFVYWESNLTAIQIEEGKADSYLINWAAQMKAYGYQVDFAPLDEMNGNWSAYYGSAGLYQAAWIHIHSLFSADTNVKFFYDPNVCGPGIACSSLTVYYPGSAYVDDVGLDGFDMGGKSSQTWAQVFDGSIPTMESFGKPLWITAEGAVNTDNQTAFLAAGFSQPEISGIMYFDAPGNGGNYTLSTAALSTLPK